MRKLSILAAIVLFCIPVIAQKPGDKATTTDKTYKAFVSRIKASDDKVNFGEVRKAYVEWVVANRKGSDAPNRDEMVKAFQAKNYAKAVELGETVIEYEIVNAGLARAISNAFHQLNNEAKAKFYDDLAHKAEHGLFLSGDGKSAETAYYALDISEEYKIMRSLGYAVSMQSLVSQNGHAFDVLAGKDEKGAAVSLYFNIDSFFP